MRRADRRYCVDGPTLATMKLSRRWGVRIWAPVEKDHSYTPRMPKNRAVYFTRGQSIRRLFFAVALIIWYLLDHDKTAPQDWAIIAVLVGGIISFIPNIRDPDDEKSLLSRSARALSGLMLLLAVVMKLGSELSKPGFWAFLKLLKQHLQPYKGTTLTLRGTGIS